MSMRNEIQAELAEAFDDPDGLADAVKSLSGERKILGEYDPATGGATGTLIIYTGRGVFGGYLAREIDGSLIQTADVKLLVLQNELEQVPKTGDSINGMRALNVGSDPVDATWTIQLRA